MVYSPYLEATSHTNNKQQKAGGHGIPQEEYKIAASHQGTGRTGGIMSVAEELLQAVLCLVPCQAWTTVTSAPGEHRAALVCRTRLAHGRAHVL
jgi:hypothetical protein